MGEEELIELQRTDQRVRPLQAAICALLPLLWAGVPFSLVNAPLAWGNHAVSVLIIIGLLIYTVQLVMGRQTIDIWIIVPLLMTAAMLFSTIISSIFFFRNPASDWVPALSNYSPILLIFLLRAIDVRISDLLFGFLFASSLVAFLITIDHFNHLAMMDNYTTYSAFDSGNRRVVLIKNDIGIGLMVCIARLAMARRMGTALIYTILLAIIGFDLIVASEVRLVLGAVLLATAMFILFGLPTIRRIFLIFAAVCLILGAGQFVFGKYIDRMMSTSDYASEDSSVSWRLITVNHYRQYLDQSNWIGFGIMSTSPTKNNIMTYSYYEAIKLYSNNKGWGVYLADTSLLGALFQFGVPGFLLTIFMSLYAGTKMVMIGRRSLVPHSKEVCAVGFFMLFLVISPWPLNFYGLNWALMSGAMLWALAARSDMIDRRVRRSVAQSDGALEPLQF